MIRFTCECGQQLQAGEENAGQPVICPGCGRQQLVPAASADAIQPGEAARPPAAGSENIQRRRPALAPPPEEVAPSAGVAGTSGKATASLILGILSVFCNVVTGLPALIVGLLALRDIGRSQGRLSGQGLAIAGIAAACAGSALSCVILLPALLLPAVQKVREAATRLQSANNLKQMALAMHNYRNAHGGRFPAAAICDKNGKPLLSWRVAILPYIEQPQLYSQFKLDEPWDSPNNLKLLVQMPKVYDCPAARTQPNQTVYQVFVGNGAAFETTRGLRLQDFPDGTANTILIVEAAQAVPWTKPDDLPFDPNQPLPPLGGHFANGFNVASADGATHFIPKNTPENTLRLLIRRNDGMPVAFP